MKNSYKAILAAVLGLTVASVAQAGSETDILLGLTDLAGPSSAQNDYTLDIGAQSGFTTMSIQSGLIASGDISTAFGSDANYANDVLGTLIGSQNTGLYPESLYLTTAGTLPATATPTGFGTMTGDIQGVSSSASSSTIQSVSAGATSQNGLTFEVAPTAGNNSYSGSYSASIGQTLGLNPFVQASSGIITEDLYLEQETKSGLTKTVGDFSELGVVTINLNNDTWSYSGVDAVPEPTTYSLIAGAGFLLVGLRRQFAKKNA